MKKNPFLSDIAGFLEEEYGWAQTERILEQTDNILQQLCRDHQDQPRAVKAHTQGKIYPCIAIYRAMQAMGYEKEKALEFLDRSCSRQAQPKAASMRAMLKIPGLHKLMPAIFKMVTLRQFGEKAGFHAEFYDTPRNRCKFDMTKCLYCDTCRACGCPELVPCFCHTDDVTDGNMHPRILWNRTKIMGDGGDCCDFDIIVLKKGEDPDGYREKAPDASEKSEV